MTGLFQAEGAGDVGPGHQLEVLRVRSIVAVLRDEQAFGIGAAEVAADQFDPDVLAFSNLYVAPAQDISCDKHGRILIPQLLRDHAGIKRDVAIVGQLTLLRIWDLDTWTELFAEQQKRAPEIMSRFLRTVSR